MQRFTDRRVLVTGAASGIGRATTHRLVAEGARVVAVDIAAEGLAETAATADGPLVTHVADLADEEALCGAVAVAVDELGALDGLANVAGIHRTTPLDELTSGDLLDLYRVNCVAPLLVCREAVPHLVRGGAIVNVASTAATRGQPYMTAYAASKGGLLAATMTLAAELGPAGIRAVVLSPGSVDTPLIRGGGVLPEDRDTSYYGRVMPIMGRPGRPEHVAGAIAFALSDDGAYLDGVELRLDGGSHI